VKRLGLPREFRAALKSLSRTPGFTLIAVVTLGLGIGANTAMFSVLNGYMLRPAPYPQSGHLYRIYRATPQDPRGGASPADYLDLKSQMANVGDVAAYGDAAVSLAEPGKPAEMAVGLRASANLFAILGTPPQLGRDFRPEEEQFGKDRVIVISHRYWQNHFGSDPSVIGRRLRVDGEPHEIIGVLPADFSDWRHLSWVDVFRPLCLDDKEIHNRESTWLELIGRRPAPIPLQQTSAFLAGFGQRLARDYPRTSVGATWRAMPLEGSFLPEDAQTVVAMLVGLSGFVLLIACSNLANLLLARTMARSREFALRSALGASRSQVLRPLFFECLLLALAGGVCSIVVALWSFDWLLVASAGDSGVGVSLGLDWRVLGWALCACVFTAFAFGIAPALFVQRLDPNALLKAGSRGTTADRSHRRFVQFLVVSQFGLAMVLLSGAALFARGLHELNNRRHGWESDGLVVGTVVLPPNAYKTGKDIVEFQRRVQERLEALPGVASASLSRSLPFFGLSEPRKYVVAGHETPEPGHEPQALTNDISARYFETVGTPVLAGRTFDSRDTTDSPRVFVINQAMARGLFVDRNPIGEHIAEATGQAPRWGEVVGVVGDVQSIYTDPNPVTYQVYVPLAQEALRLNEIAVRASGVGASPLVDAVRAAMMALDPDLPIRKLQAAQARIARANYQSGVLASMLSGLALLGLGLASLGIYGVISRTTAQRTGEFGIRLAMGARAADITRLVLASGARLALLGCAAGLLGALGISRFFQVFFPGMHTASPVVLAASACLLVVVAEVACYMPARTASRLSPAETLRAE
jgi:predicted permease